MCFALHVQGPAFDPCIIVSPEYYRGGPDVPQHCKALVQLCISRFLHGWQSITETPSLKQRQQEVFWAEGWVTPGIAQGFNAQGIIHGRAQDWDAGDWT